jgi:hypothetical protein
MYFKFKSDVPKFSYILHKNPHSVPYESELSCGKVIGKFLNENEYEISILQDNLKFLKTAKQLNLDIYLNAEFTSVCPYNLKSLYDCLRSVIRGTTNTTDETMTNAEFLQPFFHGCTIGPFVNDFEFVKEMFEGFDLTVEKYNYNDKISEFQTSFILNIKNNTECSLTEFLQKVYVISLYTSFNRKSIFNIDENTIEKLVFLSKNWLFDSPKFNMIINKFCKNNPKFKQKFYNIIKDLDDTNENQIETVNQKISLHEKRHNILIEKLKSISCTTMVDFCSSEGKLLEKVNDAYPEVRITGFEKDFYKIKKFSERNNVKMIESNILYPKISHSDVLPDLLTCVEAIEHFGPVDRLKILETIRDVVVPNYLYLTTPNVEFNKFYNLADGKYRRRDHIIEYDMETFKNEVVNYLSSVYDVEFIDIIEPVEEFENLQPSFCIFCTHKTISIEKNLIEISKPYPLKDGEIDPRCLTIKVNKLEWDAERIEVWYNDPSDYRKPSKLNKNRKVDYKKLNKIISMQGEVFLPNCGYNVNLKELNVGYTSFNFIKNSNNIFYIAPTISPVESLYKRDEISEKYGSYEQYIEHPAAAFDYFEKRGVKELLSQTKYMGSRAQILWFESKEVAHKFGFNETVIVNSRGGFKFFDEADSIYYEQIDADIRRNKDELTSIYKYDFDVLVLDAEILPWSYKAKNLINEQFRAPIESYMILNTLKSEPTDYIETVLNTLNIFSQESPVEIHPFHVLLCCNSNKMSDIKHGYHMSNLNMMDVIETISKNSTIIKPCEYEYIDLYYDNMKENSVHNWLQKCGKSPNETMNVTCNENLIEGFVYKPIKFENYLPSGYYLQPALKVRGYNYLNLTYGINLYNDNNYFEQIKNRRVGKKRMQAVQEFEMSKYILNAFINQKDNIRLKYIAAFLGMESMTSVDRTL